MLYCATLTLTSYGAAKPNGARAAAFGSGPRPFLGYDIGLRPLPSAAAFDQFVTRSLSEGNNKPRRSRLPALLMLIFEIRDHFQIRSVSRPLLVRATNKEKKKVAKSLR